MHLLKGCNIAARAAISSISNGGLTIEVVVEGACSEDKDEFEYVNECSDIEALIILLMCYMVPCKYVIVSMQEMHVSMYNMYLLDAIFEVRCNILKNAIFSIYSI